MEMPMEASVGARSRPQESRSRPSRPPPPSTVTELNTLRGIKQQHENAHRLIEQGLSCDEENKHDEAKSFYQSGLKALNSVIAVNCETIQGTAEEKDTAKEIQQKMNKTKLQIEYRVQALSITETAQPFAPQASEPGLPSYEDAMAFSALGDSIMTQDENDCGSLVANATEVFCIENDVQIFFISPEGYVSAPSYPSALKVFKFNESQASSSSQTASAFLQVGDWFYPLNAGASPVLQSNYGAYIFPDVQSDTPGRQQGSAVGLMLPNTLQPAQRQQFEQLLQSLTMVRHQQQPAIATAPMEVEESSPEEARAGEARTRQGQEAAEGEAEKVTTSTKISKGIITAAEYISWGVGKGAEKAGVLIKKGSSKLMTRLQPEQSERPVDPRLQQGIQYVRVGSHAAVKVSGYLVSKLGEATMYLAREAAPHIRRQGSKYMPASLKQATESEKGKSTVDSVIEVAASGLHGFGTVYMGLETAAKALGKSLATETVNVVSHKYGNEAGVLTENTLYSAGNLALTAHNANNFGVKAVAKRAAKDTGKAVLQNLADGKKTPPEKPPPPGSSGSGSSMNGDKR